VKRLVVISGWFNKRGEAPDMDWNLDETAQFLGPAYGEVAPNGEDHFMVVATKIGELVAVEPVQTMAPLRRARPPG
jgi:hypothetical protein